MLAPMIVRGGRVIIGKSRQGPVGRERQAALDRAVKVAGQMCHSSAAYCGAGRYRFSFLARLSLIVAARSTSLMDMRRCLSSGST
jgi:hypothetical protein